MATVDCTFDQFKRIARDFRKAAPTLELDQLENAWKCLGLAYLGMHEEMWQTSAAIVLKMETETYLLREAELLNTTTKAAHAAGGTP